MENININIKMGSQSYEIEAAKNEYEPFPEPGGDCKKKVMQVFDQLGKINWSNVTVHKDDLAAVRNGIVEGVVACAKDNNGKYYLALSSVLHRNTKNFLNFDGVGVYCTKISEDLKELGRGCAEKKILSTMRDLNVNMQSMFVTAFPKDAETTGQLIYLWESDFSYIRPCPSCKEAYNLVYPPKK